MEFKNHSEDEPFSDVNSFQPQTVRARDTRGQIAVYNTTISAYQFRTRVFSVFVNQSTCRLMCATRSGTSVTESFDYTNNPALATFFWRLSQSPPAARGLDTTFVEVTDKELKLQGRQKLQVADTEPLYRVSVVDEQSNLPSYYIVSLPFTSSHNNPTGRCTRCFRAFDIQRKQLVLLKDNWRVEGYEAEGKTYRALNLEGVKHIPTLIAAGDVLEGPGWTCGEEPFLQPFQHRIHHHYRLVLDTVGRSITHFNSTWELVRVITDAMTGEFSLFSNSLQL